MKKRIIPAVLLRGGTNVSLSQQFKPWRTVGALAQMLRLHVQRNCDELLIINMDQAGTQSFRLPPRLLALVRQEVDIPIAYAGGICSASDAAMCINAGFDKVYLTSAFLDDSSSVNRIASLVGSQSVGVCLPYRTPIGLEQPAMLWDYRQKSIRAELPLQQAIGSCIEMGAGEILLYDVDRDGTLQGLDEQLLPSLEELDIPIPLLMAGGAGSAEDISAVLGSPVIQGVVASSIFALTQETPATIRRHCENLGIAMRRL
jgi:cyclase